MPLGDDQEVGSRQRARRPLRSSDQEDQLVGQVARCVPVRRARVVGIYRPVDSIHESRLVTRCCHRVATAEHRRSPMKIPLPIRDG